MLGKHHFCTYCTVLAGFNDQSWWDPLLPPLQFGDKQLDSGLTPDDTDFNSTSIDDSETESPWRRAVLTVSQFVEAAAGGLAGAAGGFKAARPRGLTWQRAGRYPRDGLLYGEVDSAGHFTGDNITFIYPDLHTGLRGTFQKGRLVAATEVRIVAHRCRGDGLKELLFDRPSSGRRRHLLAGRGEIVWRPEETNATWVGSWPLVTDPHEWRAVYVAQSGIPDSGEGLFARRSFLPGDLVSYYREVRGENNQDYVLDIQ